MSKKVLFSIYLFLNFYISNIIQAGTQDLLVDHVIKSIENAELNISKLNEDVLNLQGMSSDRVRHFLNNICSLPDGKYLEIGVWTGSTFIAALYNNNLSTAIAIDNWSEFGGPKGIFYNNLSKYLPISTYAFYEVDCFKFDLKNIKNKINIYFYDGGHTPEEQKRAFTYYNPVLEDVFIAIVDDYNCLGVQEGTQEAFKELGYKIIYQRFLSSDKNPSSTQRQTTGWWNGIYVAVISKS